MKPKTYIINSNEAVSISISPGSLEEEVTQNLWTIITTVKGTVPLDRNFGISSGIIDKPLPVSETLIVSQVYDVVERYEPRAEIVNVSVDYNSSGRFTVKLEVRIRG